MAQCNDCIYSWHNVLQDQNISTTLFFPSFFYHPSSFHLFSFSFLTFRNVFADISSFTGQYVCGTLLCVAIFLMVVRGVELSKKKVYFWSFLAVALLVPVLVSLIFTFLFFFPSFPFPFFSLFDFERLPYQQQ